MSVGDAIKVLSKLGSRSKIRDDDYIDQLNHFVTPGLLLIAASATFLKQYMGDPIHCWTPAEYKDKDHYQPYVDSYCWITDLYNVHMDEELPKEEVDRDENIVGYYRWVSILLLLQALMFKLPNVLWVSWKGLSGLDPDRIIKMVDEVEFDAEEEKSEKEKTPISKLVEDNINVTHDELKKIPVDPENKETKKKKEENKMASLVRFVHRRLEMTRIRTKHCGPLINFNLLNKNSGYYVTTFFCLIKLLYFTVIISQFLILSNFLRTDFFSYSQRVIESTMQLEGWQDLEIFPRIAWCDFKIRQLQNIQTYTVQCVLPMNIFIEKIYAVQWFWLIFLLIITASGIIQSFVDRLSFNKRVNFVKKYLSIGIKGSIWPPPKPKVPDEDEEIVEPRDIVRNMSDGDRTRVVRMLQDNSFLRGFVGDYLKADGVFVVKGVHDNVNSVAAMDMLFRLVEYYLVEERLVTNDFSQ